MKTDKIMKWIKERTKKEKDKEVNDLSIPHHFIVRDKKRFFYRAK
jgi:hypothetical protein